MPAKSVSASMPGGRLRAATKTAVPVEAITKPDLARWQKRQGKDVQAWIAASGFTAEAGQVCLIPGQASDQRSDKGGRGKKTVAKVAFGLGAPARRDGMWVWASLYEGLPAGTYRLADKLDGPQATDAALAWALAGYRFDAYRAPRAGGADKSPALVWPDGADRAHVERACRAICLVRDLINTPAADMGPSALAATARGLATRHKATCKVIVGDQLLKKNYPAVHAVGRASVDAPRLIDITWGPARAPKVTLVGKGVTFDTGGLDLKSAAGMKLMKKDMGGAAAVLGLADMIMAAKLPVRLRVLVPAVENAVSGNAMRPLDVLNTRSGLRIEVGNTDAEGRVILSDALYEAASEKPDLLIDCATLTGAARVALGTELPALFCNDEKMAADILAASVATGDPVWRLPLWPGYRDMIVSKVGDLNNAPEGGYGGAITAALFLERFVQPTVPWAHVDMMGWNVRTRPGRPEGGEAQAIRALFAMIEKRFAA